MEPLIARLGFSAFRFTRRGLARPSPMRVIERLAERYGFERGASNWVGCVDGERVELAEDDRNIRITLRLPEDQPEDLAFVLDRDRPVPPWPFPAEDLVITGDPRFDAEAHVVGSAVRALARLDRHTRERLRSWPGLTVHRRRVTVCLSTQRMADQFMGTLRALRHTVGQICIGDDDVRPRLVARLHNALEPAAHQQAVLRSLGQAGWLDAPLLGGLLEHPRPAVRLEAATLAPTDDPGAAGTLWAMIRDKNVAAVWRAEAVHRWMARAPAERRRGGLTELLNAPYPEVAAATCFWWSQQPDGRERLAGWLKHRSLDVRAAAMIALGSLAHVLRPQEEALIIRQLHAHAATESPVVQGALQALRVGGTRSLKAVRDFLESNRSSPQARRTARVTLKALQKRRRSLPGRLAIVDDEEEGRLSLPGGQAA